MSHHIMFVILFSFIISVNENEYKQCEQLKYCYRNREISKQHWKLIAQTIEFKNDYFKANIFDSSNEKELILSIFFLNTGIRFRIEPYEEENFKRYDTSKDKTIIDNNEINSFKKFYNSRNQTHMFLRCNDETISIRIQPFMMVVSSKKGKLVSLNQDDNAIFEHNKDKKRFPSLFDANDFNGVIDKVPNGPTSVALDFFWHGDAIRINGLPEHTLNLSLPFTINRIKRKDKIDYQPISDPIRLFNVDIHRYEIGNTMSMYGAIPFLMARDTYHTTGLFWSNPSETWVDISEETHGVNTRFISETGFIDFYIFTGPKPNDVIQQYTKITGRPHLPQSFSFGFHMSRWGYKTTNEIREVMKNLDDSLIPHDSIWLDLDHTDDKHYFTFHPHNFKDIEKLQDEIDPLEKKVVALIDPHLSVDYNYPIFEKALNGHYLIRTKTENEYSAKCWPGESVWVDFLNPWAREWWETLYDFKNYKGSTLSLYVWNDMNEPSVFDVPDHTCPKDIIHYGKIENREIHNIYGNLMISATFNGLIKRDDDKDDRPFILTRSFFAGSQKYAFTWTGDNSATWEQMRASIPMILSLGISGMPYSGADVGGFFDSPDPELFVRWIQLGSWCYPFFRIHSHHKSERREPYLLKGCFLEAAKNAIKERYMMFNYWYTLSRHSNLTGIPIIRPIWWEFTGEKKYEDSEDCFMVGSSILVLPILQKDETKIYFNLPFCKWYDFRTLEEKSNEKSITTFNVTISSIPVLIRGGSIIPIKTWPRRTTYLMFNDPFTLLIALDKNEQAKGDLYIDDGMTLQFIKREFIHRAFEFKDGILTNKLYEIKQNKGDFYKKYNVKIERIKITGLRIKPLFVKDKNGNLYQTEFNNNILIIHRVNLPIKEDWSLIFVFPDNNKEL